MRDLYSMGSVCGAFSSRDLNLLQGSSVPLVALIEYSTDAEYTQIPALSCTRIFIKAHRENKQTKKQLDTFTHKDKQIHKYKRHACT